MTDSKSTIVRLVKGFVKSDAPGISATRIMALCSNQREGLKKIWEASQNARRERIDEARKLQEAGS